MLVPLVIVVLGWLPPHPSGQGRGKATGRGHPPDLHCPFLELQNPTGDGVGEGQCQVPAPGAGSLTTCKFTLIKIKMRGQWDQQGHFCPENPFRVATGHVSKETPPCDKPGGTNSCRWMGARRQGPGHSQLLKMMNSDFPAGAVAKTPMHFQCKGPRFDPCLGNKILHVMTKSLRAPT